MPVGASLLVMMALHTRPTRACKNLVVQFRGASRQVTEHGVRHAHEFLNNFIFNFIPPVQPMPTINLNIKMSGFYLQFAAY